MDKETRQSIKEGVVVEETTSGVRIWDPKDIADSPIRAEWFPFDCKLRSVVPLKDLK